MKRILSLLIGIAMIGSLMVGPIMASNEITEEPFWVVKCVSYLTTTEGTTEMYNYLIAFGPDRDEYKDMMEYCQFRRTIPRAIVKIYGHALETDEDGNVTKRGTEWKTEWVDRRLIRDGYDVEKLEESLDKFIDLFIVPEEFPDNFVMVELLPAWRLVRIFTVTFANFDEERIFHDEYVKVLNEKWQLYVQAGE